MLVGFFASVKHNQESPERLGIQLLWKSVNPAGTKPQVPPLAVYKAGEVVDTFNRGTWEVEAGV